MPPQNFNQQIVRPNEEIPNDINYWFVRTDSGSYFETFLLNGFIGINWNSITLQDLTQRNEIEVKAKIARLHEIDATTKSGRQKISDIYNKLIRFNQLRAGDIVVIPSQNSHFLAFGKIVDNSAFSERAGQHGCNYSKRRNVEWLTGPMDIDKLDPTFFKIRKARHSISNINNYDYYIDSILYNVYQKGGNSHVVIAINTTEEINLLKLAEVLKGMHEVMSIVNVAFNLGENIDEGSIRINLQSPGLFNIKQTGLSLLLAASLLGATGCEPIHQPVNTRQTLDTLRVQNAQTIDTVINNLTDLKGKI